MKTMLRKTLITLAFAFGLTTFAFGEAVETVAYWHKDFAKGSTKNGFTMSLGSGTTVNADGTVTLKQTTSGTATKGVEINFYDASGATALSGSDMTVFVRYSGLSYSSSRNAFFSTIWGDSKTAKELTVSRKGDGKFYYEANVTSSASPTDSTLGSVTAAPPTAGLMIITMAGGGKANGTRIGFAPLNEDGSYGDVVDYGYASGATYSGKKFYGIKVGGTIGAINHFHRPGMKVEGVAIVKGFTTTMRTFRYLFPDECYRFDYSGTNPTSEKKYLEGLTVKNIKDAVFSAKVATGSSTTWAYGMVSACQKAFTPSATEPTKVALQYQFRESDYDKSADIYFTDKTDGVYFKKTGGHYNAIAGDKLGSDDAKWSNSSSAYSFNNFSVYVPYTKTATATTGNWSALGWTADDIARLDVKADATMTVDVASAVALLKAKGDGKLTLKYTDKAKLVTAKIWDFTETTVALDCADVAFEGEVVLMSGTIKGYENIDIAGSALPANSVLLVSGTAVTLKGAYTAVPEGSVNFTDLTWSPGKPEGGFTSDSILIFKNTKDATVTFNDNLTVSRLVTENTAALTLQNNNATVAISTYDCSLATGTTSIDYDFGASVVKPGVDTVVKAVGTSAITIDEGMKLTVKSGEVKESKITNNGTLGFDGGSAESPIVYDTTTSATDLGKMTLAAGAYVKVKTYNAKKGFNVTGAGAESSTIELYDTNGKGQGMPSNAKFRNVTLVVKFMTSGKHLWLENSPDLFDATVDIVADGNTMFNSYDYTIGSLSGAGAVGMSGSRKLTITPSEDVTYSGTSAVPFTIAAGAGTQTLTGNYTGALTVNAGGKAKVLGSANPSSIVNNGTLDMDLTATYKLPQGNGGTINLYNNDLVIMVTDPQGTVNTLGTGKIIYGYTVTINDCGKFKIPEGKTVDVIKLYNVGGEEVTYQVEGDTLTFDWEITDKNCWWDYEFNGNVTSTGADTTTMTAEGTKPYYDEATTNYLWVGHARHYRSVSAYPQEFTAILYGKVVDQEKQFEVGFGSSTDGTKINVSIACGDPTAEEVQLLIAKEKTVQKTVSMSVPNAYKADHLYAFVCKTIADGDKEKTKVIVYLDGVEWDSYTFDEKITLGTGFQIGSIHGGIPTSPSGYAKATVDNANAFLDFLRTYNVALNAEAMSRYANLYPYTSENGKAMRTFDDSLDQTWVAAPADKPWTQKIGEESYTTNCPLPGTMIDVTATAAATVTVNLDEQANYESFTTKGEGSFTFKAGGTVEPTVSGLATIGTPVTVDYNAIKFGKTMVLAGKTLTFDFTGFPLGEVWADGSYEVTGAVTLNEGAQILATGIPTAAGRTATFGLNEFGHYALNIKIAREADIVMTVDAQGATTWTCDGQSIPEPQWNWSTLTNVTFTKKGEGTGSFIGRNGYTYTVDKGVLKFTNNVEWVALTITVNKGGAFDLDGNETGSHYNIVLNGGTLANYGEGIAFNKRAIKSITLTDDSFVTTSNNLCFVSDGYMANTLDLGGHTLTKNGSKIFILMNTTVTNGAVVVEKGEIRVNAPSGIENHTVFADDATLELKTGTGLYVNLSSLVLPVITGEGSVKVDTTLTVRNKLEGSLAVSGSGTLTLAEGAVLDLAMLEDAYTWPTQIACAETQTINLNGRTLKLEDKIIAWDAIPEGVTFQWDSETAKAGVEPKYEADGLLYGYDPESKVVDKGYWTGAVDGDGKNPANWGCTNKAGYVVADAIPTNTEATVVLNGPLTGDCDWTGLGAFVLAQDTLVDLNGHSLAIADFANRTTGIVVTNTVETTGDFVIDVPEEKTAENTTVAIRGNVRLVKEGAGTYKAAFANQTYTGGSVVNGGIATMTPSEGVESDVNAESKKHFYGANGTPLTINAEGTFELGGNYDWHVHPMTISGGTLQNTLVGMNKYNWGGVGDVTLAADSTVRFTKRTVFNHENTAVTLNGHTLTLDGTDDTKFYTHLPFVNGKVDITGGVFVNLLENSASETADFTFTGHSDYEPGATITVRDFSFNGNTGWKWGDKLTTVAGTFTPGNNAFHNTMLADGSTLNLKEVGGTWSVSSVIVGKSYKVTFAENATNTVDVTGRTIAQDDKIVAWTTQPAETTAFVFKGYEGDLEPVAEADGLYARLALVQFTIADVENATKEVEGAELVSGNTYSAKPGADVTVTYTANPGYHFGEGKSSVTVEAKAAKDITIKTEAKTEQYPAKIGGVYYLTLKAANDAAQAGDTIELLANVADGDGIFVTKDNLTFNFGGFTYTVSKNPVGSPGTENQGFHLEAANCTLQNGTITSADGSGVKMLVQNYSNLTVAGMFLDGSNLLGSGRYVLSNNAGNTTIDGDSTITAKSGDFAFDSCKYSIYPAPTVTVAQGATINGDVELSGGSFVDNGATITGEIKYYKGAYAYIGYTAYQTLTAANDAAKAGDIIVLKGNMSGDGIFVSKDVTFDFGGYTYTITGNPVGSPGTESQGFHVETAACTLKNGTVTSVAGSGVKMLVQNYASLTLKDLALDGTNLDVGFASGDYVLSNNSGDTTLDNVTITAQADDYAFDCDKTAKVTLNSGTITGKIAVTGAGPLTINGGTINGPANGKDYDGKAVITVDGGTLNFVGGTLTATGEADCGMYGVYVKNGGTATFTNPTITAWFAAIGSNNTTSPCTITVNGGTYTQLADGKGTGWAQFCAAIYAPAAGTYTINGGTFTSALYCLASPYANVEQAIAFNGGTFNQPLYVAEGQGAGTGTRVIKKADGVQIDPPAGYAWKDGKLVKCLIQKGTEYYLTLQEAFDSEGDDPVVLLGDVAIDAPVSVTKAVTLNIATFNVTPATGFAGGDGLFFVNYGGDLTVNGTDGTIDASSNANIYEAIKLTVTGETYAGARAKLTVNGGTIKGYYYGITGNGSRPGTDIVVNGGTITAVADKDNLAIFNPQTDSTVTITGGTLTGYLSAIEMRGGTLSVTGGQLTATATEYAVAASGSGTTTKGAAVAIAQHTTKGDIAVTISGGTISGEKCVSVANPQGNDTTNVAVELGQATYTGDLAFSADGNATVTDNGSGLAAPMGYKWVDGVLTKCVAKIGTEYYISLKAANDAAKDGDTIELLADVAEGDGIFVTKNVTFDFGGFTYTITGNPVGSPGTENQGFHVEAANCTLKNGTIASVAGSGVKMLVQNYSDLSLVGMTLDGANISEAGKVRYVLSNNKGNTVIENTTITANEGDFAFDTCKYASYPIPTVEVKGTSVINGDVELSGGNLTLTAGTLNGKLKDGGIGEGVITKAPGFEAPAPEGYVWDSTGKLVKAVAKIGDVYYISLNAALEAAKDDDTVTLLADITTAEKAPFTIAKDITLDFGAYTVTKTVANDYTFDIPNGATVTFKGTTGGAKQAASDKNPTSPASMIRNKGNLTIAGGVYTSDFCIVKNDEDPGAGTLTVNGGTFNVVQTEGGYTGFQTALMNWATATLNGGTWNGAINTRSCDGNAVSKAGTTEIAAELEGSVKYVLSVGYEGDTTYENVPKIKGVALADVELRKVPTITDDLVLTEKDGYITVAKAVAKIGNVYYISLKAANDAAKAGETIELLADVADGDGIFVTKDVTFDFGGFTYTVAKNPVGSPGTENQGFHLETANCTLQNGTITSADGSGVKMLVQNYSNLTVAGMFLDGSNLLGSGRYVLSNNAGNTTVTGTTITAKDGDFALDSCKYSIYDAPTVTLDETDTITGKVELSGGTLVPNGAEIDVSYAGKFAYINYVPYTTLKAAFDAVESSQTIEIADDLSGDGIFVAANKITNVTVKFNGHTYTFTGNPVGSTGTENQGFHLEAGNTLTFLGGTITSTAGSGVKMLVQNYANLLLWGTVLDGTNLDGEGKVYTLSTNNGKTTLMGATVKARGAGDIAFDVCCFSPYTANKVLMQTGTTVTGDIEVSSYNDVAPELKLNGGTVNGKLVMGTGADKASITKAPGVELAAPEGYVWDATGKLVKAAFTDGTNFYITLTEAFEKAASGATITLLVDQTLTTDVAVYATVPAGKTLTLDLAGKTITATSTFAAAQNSSFIENYGTLTVKGGEGGIAYSAPTSTNGRALFTNCGTLTIEDGTYTQGAGSTAYVVDNLTNGTLWEPTLTVNGGSLVSAGNTAIRQFANSTTKTGTINVNGGYIEATYYALQIRNANASKNKASVTIEGGTFEATASSWNCSVCSWAQEGESNAEIAITITGGTFNDYVCIEKGGTNSIEGGLFAKKTYDAEGYKYDLDDYCEGGFAITASGVPEYPYTSQFFPVKVGPRGYETLVAAVAAAESGDSVNMYAGLAGDGIFVSKDLTFDFGGFTYEVTANPVGSKGTESQGFHIETANCVLTNGTITSTSGSGVKMLVQNYANLTVTDMTLDGTNLDVGFASGDYVLSNNKGDITLDNVTINAQADDYAFDVDKTAKVTLESGTINGKIAVTGAGPLTINGGTINGPANGAAYDGKAVITVDGGTLVFNAGTLTATGAGDSGMYGVYVKNGGAATFGTQAGGPTITAWFAAIGTNNTTPGLEGVTITINNGTYTQLADGKGKWWSYFCAAVYAPAAGTYTVNGGNLDGALYSIAMPYENVEQTITVNGGTLDPLFVAEGEGAGIGTRTITVGPAVQVAAPAGYAWEIDASTGYKTLKKAAARIGTTYYLTLKAANDEAKDGDTIELLADASGDGIFVTKAVTFDFGGFTYTITGNPVGSPGTENQGFHLEAATCTITDGTITSVNGSGVKMLVQNYSGLTLTGVTLDGTRLPDGAKRYVLSNNNGATTLGTGTTIIAKKGDFAFDVCGYSIYAGTQVKVEGADIIGDIEFSSDTNKHDLKLDLLSGTLDGYIRMEAAGADKVVAYKANGFDAFAPAHYRWGSDATYGTLEPIPTQTTDVPVSKTVDTGLPADITIPAQWFNDNGADPILAQNATTNENGVTVAQSYVLGLNPKDEEDVIAASVVLSNGTVVVQTTDKGPEARPLEQKFEITYSLFGKDTLAEEWVELITSTNKSAIVDEEASGKSARFYKTTLKINNRQK